MAEHLGFQEFQSLVDVLGCPGVRLNVEALDDSVKLAGGFVAQDVHIENIVRNVLLLIVGQTRQNQATLLSRKIESNLIINFFSLFSTRFHERFSIETISLQRLLSRVSKKDEKLP